MKYRPINLKPWEARAFAQGSKTRITRVITPQPPEGSTLFVGNYFPMVVGRDGEQRPAKREVYGVWSEDGEYACKSPFGQPGDEIWGRETWQEYCPMWLGAWCGHGTQEGIEKDHRVVYRADDHDKWLIRDTPEEAARLGRDVSEDVIGPPAGWKAPGTMPRWASRIAITIKSVRFERVQDISEADAISEGFPGSFSPAFFDGWEMVGPDGEMPSQEFAKQFDIDNGPNSWDANPWVWVYQVERKGE